MMSKTSIFGVAVASESQAVLLGIHFGDFGWSHCGGEISHADHNVGGAAESKDALHSA
jgi:hypothetical protein